MALAYTLMHHNRSVTKPHIGHSKLGLERLTLATHWVGLNPKLTELGILDSEQLRWQDGKSTFNTNACVWRLATELGRTAFSMPYHRLASHISQITHDNTWTKRWLQTHGPGQQQQTADALLAQHRTCSVPSVI